MIFPKIVRLNWEEDGHKKARYQRASGICMVCKQLCVITPPAKGSGATSRVQKSLKCSSSDTFVVA